MKNLADQSKHRRHSLSDWLALHELDPVICRRILDAMSCEPAGEPAADKEPNVGYQALDPEAAWRRTAEAMREFLPEQRSIIDDTFKNTAKIDVKRNDTRKAVTLDNGPAAYPTIFYTFRGEPSDRLIIAHEFAHAIQIRASRGKFVPPIMREVCAFLGEHALLCDALRRDAPEYSFLIRVWRQNNLNYLGKQRDRLKAALSRPDAPYNYSWNYPLARYLAIEISERCSRDWIWNIFQGGSSVREVLRELALSTR